MENGVQKRGQSAFSPTATLDLTKKGKKGGQVHFSLRAKRGQRIFSLSTRCRVALSSQFGANQVDQVKAKATIVGLITPHFLKVIELAKQAEAGVNVDWHVRDTVAKTIDDLGHQYNARDLLSAYIQGLETAARDAGQGRKLYTGMLQIAASMAAREIEKLH